MPKEAFFKPSVTVDVVVFTIIDNTLKLLTIKRAGPPFQGSTALPGGFLHAGETTLDAAKRILKDKVGLKNLYIEQLYTFDNPKRDPRGPVISVSYLALAPKESLLISESEKTQHPDFLPLKGLGKMAFDHTEIIKYAHERVRTKLEYSTIARSLLPKKFTFSELQRVYETILVRSIDKRNFRKKIIRLGLVKATREKVKLGRQRPALLHTFVSEKTEIFKNPF